MMCIKNRRHVKNRIGPETYEKLAEADYQYDHDPSVRAAILFGHEENFLRGVNVEASSARRDARSKRGA